MTGQDGSYRLQGLPAVNLRFEKDGFEAVGPVGSWFRDVVMNRTLQPVVRVAAGDRSELVLRRDDPGYDAVADSLEWRFCQPCKRIRVTVPRSGVLHVRVTHNASAVPLGLVWEGEGSAYRGYPEISALAPVSAGEVRVLVGLIGADPDAVTLRGDVRVRISTSFKD
jgi:hypothetical protein